MPISPSTQKRRRFIWVALAVIAASAVAFCAVTYRLFIDPVLTSSEKVDAVVVLAGGQGERLEKALELMAAGVAPTLALSMGGPEWTRPPEVPIAVRSLCHRSDLAFKVVCVWAEPDSTVGEAGAWASVAADRGWKSLLVVTSDSHLNRSIRWFERCFDGEVYGVPASEAVQLALLVHEWGGVLAQLTIHRRCIGRVLREEPPPAVATENSSRRPD